MRAAQGESYFTRWQNGNSLTHSLKQNSPNAVVPNVAGSGKRHRGKERERVVCLWPECVCSGAGKLPLLLLRTHTHTHNAVSRPLSWWSHKVPSARIPFGGLEGLTGWLTDMILAERERERDTGHTAHSLTGPHLPQGKWKTCCCCYWTVWESASSSRTFRHSKLSCNVKWYTLIYLSNFLLFGKCSR